MKELQYFGDEETAHGEPASSKDSLTKIHSPRTSKSGGTVIQRVREASKGRKESQSEECTSSASDQFQEPPMHTVGRTILKNSNTHIVTVSKSGTSSKSRDKPKSSSERSQTSHSMANRASLEEEAQSKRERKAEKRTPDNINKDSKAEPCSPPPIPADSLAKPPLPPADPLTQKTKHRFGKRRMLDPTKDGDRVQVAACALHMARSCSSGNADNNVCGEELFALHEGAEERPGFFTLSSATVPSLEVTRRDTDAMAPPDIPQFRKKQRSRSGKRPSPPQPLAPPGHLGASRMSAKRQQSNLWIADPSDHDYVSTGLTADMDTTEIRTPRLSRMRTQPSAEAHKEDDMSFHQRRFTTFAGRDSDPLQTHSSLTRSTRSTPMDFSPLWKDFYPAVTAAKRMRGFNLSSAINRLQEQSEESPVSCERAPFSLVRKPRASCQGSEVSEYLRQDVQQSVSGVQASRQSFGSYLTGNAPTVPSERPSLANRFGSSVFGKALKSSESQNQGLPKLRSDDDLRLPLDRLTDSNLEPHLDAWEKELGTGDVTQSSVRKRQQADVQHLWEDFYESENLEKTVLSDLLQWLEPEEQMECLP